MIKARSKKISLLLVFMMLTTLFVGLGTASAGDPVKVSGAFTNVTDGTTASAGTITVLANDFDPVATSTQTLYVTVDLPSGVTWSAVPTAANLVNTPVAAGGVVLNGTASDTSVSFMATCAGAATTALVFASPDLIIDSGVTGDIAATITLQNVTGAATNWVQTATPVIAKASTKTLTATAKTAESYSSVPQTNVAGANITIAENQSGVFVTPQTVTLTIQNSGVTFNTLTAPAGSAGLSFGAGVKSGDSKSATYTWATGSNGVGGKVTFAYTLDMAPNASNGDVTIVVSSSNSKLSDTTLTVATLGSADFKVTPKDLTDRNVGVGSVAQTIGDLEINPSSTFKASGSLEVTLKNAKWNVNPLAGDITGAVWVAGGRFADNRSLWYTAPAAASAATIVLSLPQIDVDADAAPGDVVVTLGGTAGVTGDYVVGQILAPITMSADKPVVKVNTLNQAAGDIKITEARKAGFTANGNLKLSLPNGVSFSANPKVYFNGTEVSGIAVVAGTGKGESTIEWTNAAISASYNNATIETIEIKGITYDVDSRYESRDITVEASGQVLTGAGGSTNAIASVANAVGESKNTGGAAFVIGSTSFTMNGVTKTMDVAPYAKDGRTFMPVRFVANALGIDDSNILWDQAAQTVTLMKGDKVVQVKIGSTNMLINGANISMDVAPEVASNRTMLPLRFIAQAFGATMTWDQATNTAGFTF